MIQAIYAANFVMIFGFIYEFTTIWTKKYIFKWTSRVQFYRLLLMFICWVNWVMKTKCILRCFVSKDLELKWWQQVILTKNWSLSTLQTICRRVDETGSAVARRAEVEVCVAAAGEHFDTLFNYWADSWHSSQKGLNCWRKAVQSLIRFSWIFNAQLHLCLKKWNLKFKLLYPLNHISCFDEIRRICCVNTYT